jgi:hypothetical protein
VLVRDSAVNYRELHPPLHKGPLGAAITDGLKLPLKYFRPPIEINIKLQGCLHSYALQHHCDGNRKSGPVTALTSKAGTAEYIINLHYVLLNMILF